MFLVLKAIVAVLSIASVAGLTQQEYEASIIFYGYKETLASRFVSTFNSTIAAQGCDQSQNITIIAHGWMEGVTTPWVPNMVLNFLLYRGGCLFFMDYSKFANVTDYFTLTPHFVGITAVLTKKMQQIGNYNRQLCFGFSFGSRVCIGAGKTITGTNITNPQIGRMELCDPAGPGFDVGEDPTPAAKNIACIHTSTDKGTGIYNCHQNFRMGCCGSSQAAAGPYPLGNHGLCPYFYSLAFNNSFVVNNDYYKCSSPRLAKNLTSNVAMGYNANFNRTLVRGDIFIVTAKYPPYVVINNVIDNAPKV